MKYLSLCSGIEAATVAWHPLGWEAVAYSEIERFPSEVLAHHYPNTPNLGDMTKFKEWTNVSDVDVLVGGTPCQSFSVAGLRKGLDDPRGNLMLTYLAIAKQHRPNWLVWENVPGVLSSNGGRDFGSFLGGLAECGYGFAYRVLDAQFFGVAQRRRRVFVVGYLGDWRAAAAVLFERHSLQGHPAPSREKRQSAAASVGAGASVGSLCARTGQSISVHYAAQGHLLQWPPEIAPTIEAHFVNKQGLQNLHINGGGECLPLVSKCLITKNRMDAETETLIPTTGGHFNSDPVLQPAYGIPGNWIGRKPENGGNATEPMYDVAPCLTKADQHGVAQPIPLDMMNIRGRPSDDGRANRIGRGYGEVGDPMFTITKANHHGVAQPTIVHGTQDPCVSDIAFAQGRNNGGENVLIQAVGTDLYNGNITGDVAATMGTPGSSSNASGPTVMQAMAVRRLTPVECERLQGFGDNYTNIKSKGKPTPDGPRYKALGNSMAVPVMAWIGQRIEQVEAICKQNK
jgi:DNA (cytosine-5)-methyltransferase 1